MAGNAAPLVAAQDARAAAQGGFARDFGTADGQRVMVAVFTRQQFADLAEATRLAGTFAFLERALSADFSTRGDLYAHRGAIAALLAPWFSRRTVAGLAAALAGTSVPWARLSSLTGIPALGRRNGRLPSPVASWAATLSGEIESLKSDDPASPG